MLAASSTIIPLFLAPGAL